MSDGRILYEPSGNHRGSRTPESDSPEPLHRPLLCFEVAEACYPACEFLWRHAAPEDEGRATARELADCVKDFFRGPDEIWASLPMAATRDRSSIVRAMRGRLSLCAARAEQVILEHQRGCEFLAQLLAQHLERIIERVNTADEKDFN